jgi:hypothetical protein
MANQDSSNDNTDTDEDQSQDIDEGMPKEYGGPKGKEPTRYGDWEKKGRCVDF